MTEWKIYRMKKREKVRWKQNLYYLPSLEESSRGTRVRFNYLYFVIMHRVKRGFLSRKKKDGVRSRIYIFMNNSFDKKKKKKSKKGKKRCLYAKGPHKNAAALIFFAHPIIQRCPAGRPIPEFEWKLTLNDTMFK